MHSSEKSARFRTGLIYVGFVGFLSLVALRLIQLQVRPHPILKTLAARQLHRTGKTAPYRLPIYDRNGEELAISVPSSSVFARPKLVLNKKRTAKTLASFLGGSAEKWLKRLNSPKPFIWISRHLSPDVARKVAARKLPGIFIETESKRVYPHGNLAAHVLGFTDIDGNGISGIELRLNSELLQEQSSFALLRDGRGKPSYLGKRAFSEGATKTGIYLTLDRRLQNLLEEELENSLTETGAKAVLGVLLHPRTGEVLAMAQRPSFDPNYPNRYPEEVMANRVVSHLMEPGSTVKALFAAEALELGLVRKDSLVSCEKGRYRVGNKVFGEAHRRQFDRLSIEKVLRFSSNIGAIKIGQLLGKRSFTQALSKFGLESKTGIDLPGEVTASKSSSHWTPIHLATASFGQGISATPLQVVSAFLPFANGGYLIRPSLVRPEAEITPVMKRVLSPQTAASVRDMLVSVTEGKGGTGGRARMSTVSVAGKTGTAQKFDREQGYHSGKYFSSFVGFFPADQPEVVMGVMVDEPEKEGSGAEVAAPLFKRIGERAWPLLNNKAIQSVTDIGEFIDSSVPGQWVLSSSGKWIMPDLKGTGMRDALRLVGPRLSRVTVSGYGYLVEQKPTPGESVQSNTPVHLHFRPSG